VNGNYLLKYSAALLGAAVFSACSGGPAGAPATSPLSSTYVGKILEVNGRLVTAARAPSALPTFATLLPDAVQKAKHFEYIDNDYGTYASIFDYPKGADQIGKINDVGGQACTNVLYGYGKKLFWIVAGDTEINEYKVPKTLIKTLSDSEGMPSSCAIDTSGDLAVGILNGSGSGEIIIYKGASGAGTPFSTPLTAEFFDGYDKQGNLFATGLDDRERAGLVELPKGGSTFETIATPNTLGFPGSVQWDGKYVTVFDQSANALYQYTISGTTATLKHTVALTGSVDCAQTWIVKGLIYCADAGTNDGEVFKYPAGGSPVAVFTGSFDLPLGTTAVEK
jgi:hypothetical protein